MAANDATPSDFARVIGANLRAARKQQGMSLRHVEEQSGGYWKAVVVGSYERGQRAVTVQKFCELADFYRVPVTTLLPGAPLVTEAFAAITAAQEARFEAMAMRYEAEINRLRALIPQESAA